MTMISVHVHHLNLSFKTVNGKEKTAGLDSERNKGGSDRFQNRKR